MLMLASLQRNYKNIMVACVLCTNDSSLACFEQNKKIDAPFEKWYLLVGVLSLSWSGLLATWLIIKEVTANGGWRVPSGHDCYYPRQGGGPTFF
jgi:hypothetical protein